MKRRTAILALPAVALGLGAGLLADRRVGASAPGKGTVAGRVRIRRGRGQKKDGRDVVVFLDGVRTPPIRASNEVHEIRQINRRFVPYMSAVLVGTTINFPNDDKIYHNVFSTSKTQPFDLALYAGGVSRNIVTQRVGIIDVQCDRHHEMQAYIRVFDHRHFQVTGDKGEFELRNVPPGHYVLEGWIPDGVSWRQPIEVSAGQVTAVEFEVEQDLHRPRKLRKDGTHYRYPAH